jgi:hypothetical protein
VGGSVAWHVHGAYAQTDHDMMATGSSNGPRGKRTEVKPPATTTRYVRGNTAVEFMEEQVKTVRSVATRRMRSTAPKGMKDRGD